MRVGRSAVTAGLSCAAFLLVGGASAWADSTPSITINGMPEAQSKIQVSVSYQPYQQAGGTLTISNSGSNGAGNTITGVSGVASPGQSPLGYATFNSPLPPGDTLQGVNYVPIGCNVPSDTSFQCSGLSVQPGDQQTIFVTTADPSQGTVSGFQSLDIQINNGKVGACPQQDAIFAAHVADNCNPPSNTKITSAKIQGNKAFFTFKAKGATGYRCTLVQAKSKKLMFNAPCNNGRKPYANGLPAGKYAFEVWGTNGAGYDKRPAVRVFTASRG